MPQTLHPLKKKQHFVPQLYLRRFANENEQLVVLDKPQGKVFSARVADVAQGRFFYDIPAEAWGEEVPENYNPQFIEDALSGMESEFEPVLAALLRTVEREGIRDELRTALSVFIAIQDLRTSAARSQLLELERKAYEIIENTIGGQPGFTPSPSITSDREALHHAQSMLSPDLLIRSATSVSRQIWIVGINKTGVPLYTSDHPIVRKPHVIAFDRSYIGLDSEGVELSFPLSPTHLLTLLERHHHAPDARFDGKTVQLTPAQVAGHNKRQVMQSTRQVYSLSGTLSEAQHLCRRVPAICDPSRPYVQVTETEDLIHFRRIR